MHRCVLCPSGSSQVGDGKGWGTARPGKGSIRPGLHGVRSGWVNKAGFPRGLGAGGGGPRAWKGGEGQAWRSQMQGSAAELRPVVGSRERKRVSGGGRGERGGERHGSGGRRQGKGIRTENQGKEKECGKVSRDKRREDALGEMRGVEEKKQKRPRKTPSGIKGGGERRAAGHPAGAGGTSGGTRGCAGV